MVSFNILGDCVSRDAVTMLNKLFGGVKVLQYHAISNPISIFSEKGNIELQADNFEGKNKTLTDFRKRCMMQDVNKTVLDYVFKKNSDYFILDIADARLPLMRKNNHYFTRDLQVRLSEMSECLQLNTYEELSPFTDISIEQWKDCMEKLADTIQEHYKLNQIILNVHYGVKKYKDDLVIQNFKSSSVDFVNKYNPLLHQLFEILENRLDGCHIIKFPENVIADKAHWLGLLPLHYHNDYYRYAGEAIKVILRNLPDHEEKTELERLRKIYSEHFEVMQIKQELCSVKNKSEWRYQALMFTKVLALDFYGDGNFANWLEKNNGKKVVVLRCCDIAGQILIKGLNKYGFDIVFTSQAANFDQFTDEQMSLCKKADIVISANVHTTNAPQRDGIKAVCIYDLLKDDSDLKTDTEN